MLKLEGMGFHGWRGLKFLVSLEIEDVFQNSKERQKKEQQGSSRLNNSDPVSNQTERCSNVSVSLTQAYARTSNWPFSLL